MTSTLIVLAHPDRTSFNGSWAQATAQASKAMGHKVLWSDLCMMNFDPVEKRSHYAGQRPGAPFDVLKVQEAAASNMLPRDVSAEIDKIQRADRIVFHFPIWWFSPPAILTGWCERVLANGALHDVDNRFDQGLCRGKTALFCVTTGSKASESAHNGKEGDTQMLLWPFAYTLRYLGFTILEPKTIHGVHSYHKEPARTALQSRLTAEIKAHGQTMAKFDALPRMPFNTDLDFDADGVLRPNATSHSQFIRHLP